MHMRDIVDGIVYDTNGAQFVAGYKARRRQRRRRAGAGDGGGDRIEGSAMYVMSGRGGKKRIFLVVRPEDGEAFVDPIDAGMARVVVGEWDVHGKISKDKARLALATLDMVAPMSDSPPPPSSSGDGGDGDGGSGA